MKCKLIMLETINKTSIYQFAGEQMVYRSKIAQGLDNLHQPFYFYLIDKSAKINTGDYVYHPIQGVFQYNDSKIDLYEKSFKIIGSNNESLVVTFDYHGEPETNEDKICYSENLLQLSNKLINFGVDHFNKTHEKIVEVDVINTEKNLDILT